MDADAVRRYDAHAAEEKWSQYWLDHKIFERVEDDERERRYVLVMFSYPSGDLHMGHAENYAISDMLARYWRLRGFNVMYPVGWDSFGLPAENAAIARNAHPAEWTYANIETQAASFRRFGAAVDWSTRLHTSDEEYYQWTQWLFKRLYERGLAYRKDSYVNWCPKDQTVLANEQVVNGVCERCGTEVTKRKMNQWYFKITEYAQRLLDDMDQLGGWPDRILAMQRNWIGRSEGAKVNFDVEGHDPVTVFTTRPDTIFGATFMVVAPDSDLASELVSDEQREAFQAYADEVKKATEIERQSTEREKTGVFLGVHATNPLTGEKMPIWAADYVLSEYGTGAIMAVPAHDERDMEFARKFGLPVRTVIDTGEDDPSTSGVATSGDGVYVNSGVLDGLTNKAEGISAINAELASSGRGEATINYRLRDWLLSRQRYWGCPIPVVHCEKCGEVLVPDAQLPVTLPDLQGAALAPKGESPLSAATDWKTVDCPQCGGPATRDTDTMDTFVDSSWYFLRYCSPHYTEGPFDEAEVRKWMPITQYIGGAEHAVLHLMYARFFVKALHDMGMIDFDEVSSRLLNQGQVINQGKAMSKSLGNGVDLGQQMDEFGVDAVRTAVIFAGPPEDDIDWADVSPASIVKFLQRAYRIAADVDSAPGVNFGDGDVALRSVTHKMIRDITALMESQRLNVVIARTMELVNATRKTIDAGKAADPAVREAAQFITQCLSLVAPYVAEEMWELLGFEPSVANSTWPEPEAALLVEDSITVVVQVQGKVRASLSLPADVSEEDATAAALADPGVVRALDGRSVQKVIVRLPKVISLVPGA